MKYVLQCSNTIPDCAVKWLKIMWIWHGDSVTTDRNYGQFSARSGTAILRIVSVVSHREEKPWTGFKQTQHFNIWSVPNICIHGEIHWPSWHRDAGERTRQFICKTIYLHLIWSVSSSAFHSLVCVCVEPHTPTAMPNEINAWTKWASRGQTRNRVANEPVLS